MLLANPKGGRQKIKQDFIPEPVQVIHYQDQAFEKASDIDIVQVVDDFKSSLPEISASKLSILSTVSKKCSQPFLFDADKNTDLNQGNSIPNDYVNSATPILENGKLCASRRKQISIHEMPNNLRKKDTGLQDNDTTPYWSDVSSSRDPDTKVDRTSNDSVLNIKKPKSTKDRKQKVVNNVKAKIAKPLKHKKVKELVNTQDTKKYNKNSQKKCRVEKEVADENKQQQFKCTQCNYVGNQKKRLTEHMGRMHGLLTVSCKGSKTGEFPCEQCGKTFVFGKDLSRHKRIVHHSNRFSCQVCGKSYKAKYVFEKHMSTHKDGYVQPMFKCEV